MLECKEAYLFHYARETYSASSVLITSESPTFTKNGTWTVNPVSTVAGFDPPLAVSPLMPGSVSTTFSSTVIGS